MAVFATLAAVWTQWNASAPFDALMFLVWGCVLAAILLAGGAVAVLRGARDAAAAAGGFAVFGSFWILPAPQDAPITWFQLVYGGIMLMGGLLLLLWRILYPKPKSSVTRPR